MVSLSNVQNELSGRGAGDWGRGYRWVVSSQMAVREDTAKVTGIGSAIARAFVVAGCARIVITDVNAASLEKCSGTLHELASSPGLDVLAIHGDISSPDFVKQLFDTVKSRFGRLDYAVNCAGIVGNNLPSDQSSVEDFDKVTGVNYRGLWLCEKEELAIMKEQEYLSAPSASEGIMAKRRQRGSIVNVASQLAIVGRSNARMSQSLHRMKAADIQHCTAPASPPCSVLRDATLSTRRHSVSGSMPFVPVSSIHR